MNLLNFFLALYLFFPNSVVAQNQGLSVGLCFSPDYHHEVFSNDSYTSAGHEYGSRLKYSSGLILRYQIIEQIGLSVGGVYARKGYELTYNWTFPNQQTDPVIPQKTYFGLDFFDLPVSVNFSVIANDKLKISPSVGYTPSFILSSTERSIMGNGDYESTSFHSFGKYEVRKMKWLRFGILADFHINDKFYVTVEPYYTYSRNTIKSEHTAAATNTFGLFCSFNYWLFRKDN